MTEKRFIPIFDGIDKRVVGAKDNGEIISFMDMFDLLNEQDKRIKELERFKLSIISFAECNENINRRTLNDLIGEIDYD